MNATETEQRFKVTVSGLPGLAVSSDNELTVPATQARSHPIKFATESVDMPAHDAEKSAFLLPN